MQNDKRIRSIKIALWLFLLSSVLLIAKVWWVKSLSWLVVLAPVILPILSALIVILFVLLIALVAECIFFLTRINVVKKK